MMGLTETIGYTATAISSVSLLPQIYRTWKRKSARDLSLAMCIMGLAGAGLWFVYGILLISYPVILVNCIIFLSFLLLLIFKLKYK